MYSNKFISKAKKYANRIHKTNIKYSYCPTKLYDWIGIGNIYSNNNDKSNFHKYSILKGDYSKIKIIDNKTISYKDHVSRIYTRKTDNLSPDAIYTLPNITNKQPDTSPW